MATTFWIKCCNLLLVIGIVLGYNSILHSRTQSATIAQLEYDAAQQTQPVTTDAAPTTDARYQDGTYQGEAQGYGGTIVMEATITNGTLSDLQILSATQEDAAYLEAASAVIDAILVAQSTDTVDTISGATFSSRGILQATAEALGKAESPS
jgi:uncharacterized protein with FMN-binding domain